MQKFKLAFAVSLFFEFGGMQRTMLRIALECVRRGHEVHMFTGDWLDKRPDGLTVHLLNTRALSNVRSNDRLAQKLRAAVTSDHYDCVVGFTKIPGLDVYYAGDPCYAARIYETKGHLYKLTPRYRGFCRQEAAVFAPASDTEILLIAHQERDKFIRYYGTQPERFHLLPPGINKEWLLAHIPGIRERQQLRRKNGLMADDLMIVTVASRFKTKGLDRSMLALSALPSELRCRSKLVVVGDDKQGAFSRLARRLGIEDRVIFAGAHQDIARFYFAADFLIHPPYSENTGTVLIEAMLCGLPVLATANCGFAFHIAKAQAGLICPTPFEQATLNRMLAELLTSNQRSTWKTNGPRYCEKTDLYGLIDRAADAIIARAEKNRSQQ